jgi:sec-independent protein translocase protein TatA
MRMLEFEVNMGFLGGHLPEIIIVLVVILIIWGPGKLPDIGAGIGKGIREFRKASTEADDATTGDTAATPVPVMHIEAAAAQPEPSAATVDATTHQPSVSG